VPYTRGEEVSRPFEDVLTEIVGLVEQGVKEITLLGQNVNAYRGVMGGTQEIADFALLLEYMSEIPGLERIRFTTSHPKEFTQRLIDVYEKVPQLVSHLHLPVQHASDKILAAMKRGYTALEFKSIIRRMRNVRPNLSLSSDFIVGFPGETDEDFEKLMEMVVDLNFDNSYSFIFSPRPGTPAANLEDTTPYEIKLKRLQRLIAQIDSQALTVSQAMLGNTERVLIEGFTKDNQHLLGRTENNRVVNITIPKDDQNERDSNRWIGEMLDVKITEVLKYTLRGEIVHAIA
jgi:tRNA-2-methylthio-N6-dimethylallyladenosine synthase